MPSCIQWLLLGSFGQTWTIFVDRNTNFNINLQIFPVVIQFVRADGQSDMAELIREFLPAGCYACAEKGTRIKQHGFYQIFRFSCDEPFQHMTTVSLNPLLVQNETILL